MCLIVEGDQSIGHQFLCSHRDDRMLCNPPGCDGHLMMGNSGRRRKVKMLWAYASGE